MLRRLSRRSSQGSSQGPDVEYQVHQKEEPAAAPMPSAYTKKVLDNRASALFDEIDLDRQISRSNSGEQRSASPERSEESRFSALSDDDREMAAWLAEQGVDVSHLGAFNGTGVSEEPQPTAALARARRASGASAGAPAAVASRGARARPVLICYYRYSKRKRRRRRPPRRVVLVDGGSGRV